MDRAWPLAALYLAAVSWLMLSPNPRELGVEAGQTWADVAMPAARGLSPEQAQLADIKLDIDTASLPALIALPEVGEGLAEAILEARRKGPVGCESALLPLLGAGRMSRLRPFLNPLPKSCRKSSSGVK